MSALVFLLPTNDRDHAVSTFCRTHCSLTVYIEHATAEA